MRCNNDDDSNNDMKMNVQEERNGAGDDGLISEVYSGDEDRSDGDGVGGGGGVDAVSGLNSGVVSRGVGGVVP